MPSNQKTASFFPWLYQSKTSKGFCRTQTWWKTQPRWSLFHYHSKNVIIIPTVSSKRGPQRTTQTVLVSITASNCMLFHDIFANPVYHAVKSFIFLWSCLTKTPTKTWSIMWHAWVIIHCQLFFWQFFFQVQPL